MANFDFKSKTKTRLLEIVQMSGVMPITTARRMNKAELVAALEDLQSAADAKAQASPAAEASAGPSAVPETAQTALTAQAQTLSHAAGTHKPGDESHPEHNQRARSIMMTPEDLIKLEEEQPVPAKEVADKPPAPAAVKKPRRSRAASAHRKTETPAGTVQSEHETAAKAPVTRRSSQAKAVKTDSRKPPKAADINPAAEVKPGAGAADITAVSAPPSSSDVKVRPKRVARSKGVAKKTIKAADSVPAAGTAAAKPATEPDALPLVVLQQAQATVEPAEAKPLTLIPPAETKPHVQPEPQPAEKVSAVSAAPEPAAPARAVKADATDSPAATTAGSGPVAPAAAPVPSGLENSKSEPSEAEVVKPRKSHSSRKSSTTGKTNHARTTETAEAHSGAAGKKKSNHPATAAKPPVAAETGLSVPESKPEADTSLSAETDNKTRSSSHHERQIDSGETVSGVLEIMPDGYGFLRRDNYLQGPKDIYVPPQFIRRLNLREGDFIVGPGRVQREIDRYQAIYYIKSVNGLPPERVFNRPHFDRLTPIYPDVQYVLETTRNELSTRIIDLVAPIGKGQRGMIVSPPKAGKTILLQKIANAISTNNPDSKLIVLLIDERPEEVTDMQRSIKGEVVYSTFDKAPENHVKITELVLARAMRLVESGEDVVILLDSITRLGRAYNLTITPTGRTLSGGLDPGALFGPKRFFGAARNIENGGSLTIVATALIDTGSRMDEVIFEEFKGTGNMEVYLDRKLSEKRIFPAIDINRSGTRREELLLQPQALDAVWSIRKAFSQLDSANVTETIINLLLKTADNQHFISSINVSMNNKSLFESMRGPGLNANRPAANTHNMNTGYNQR
ncbi:MAG: transcription termination factor Rho [Oscillospiraceae bacterium]|nr:transcription termination factor Rho [Oscillospiraceae bacterium]MDD4367995.1 transcription termination factor Rho [Oscillospiraceae bacterium]